MTAAARARKPPPSAARPTAPPGVGVGALLDHDWKGYL
jgi:hypothetical protein